MEEKLKALYLQGIDQFHLDFDHDPEYQIYYTQAKALWEGEDMPAALYHLLNTGNFLSFVHGFRLGLELAGWARKG